MIECNKKIHFLIDFSIENPFAHYESLYDKPWTRIGPYLIGMATGWYLFKIKCKLRLNKVSF